MAANLSMSLDEIISSNKKSNPGGGRRRGGRGAATSGGGGGGAIRNRRSGGGGGGGGAAGGRAPASVPYVAKETTKIMISNLNPNVTEPELRELFASIGPVKSVVMNFDAQGRSKGSATAMFRKAEDAYTAVQQFHNRTLDNRPMRLELVMSAAVASLNAVAPAAGASSGPSRNGGGIGGQGRGGRRRGGPGGAGGGRGGRSGGPRKPKSAADLDADLDSYMKDETMTDAAPDANGGLMSIA
ncbi:hypothetical protein HDU67_001745 [Dinochytrium kinnereticum]|nr:hypothetical protein HDU67_001745 [Dinochytrium kinnereticum]